MRDVLDATVFLRRERALANLTTLSSKLAPELQGRLAGLIGSSPDPDTALHFVVRFLAEKPVEFDRIARNPALLLPLITVFSNTRFLSEELLQHPEWLENAVLDGDLHRTLGAEEMELRLESFLFTYGSGFPAAMELARFRRQQILRILLRDTLGLCTLAETTLELSNLADAILHVTYQHIHGELVKRHGTPRVSLDDGSTAPCEFSVIALGKLGGQELNYSSDIDLMFLYSGNGETSGDKSISNKEFFKKAANQFTSLLSTYTPDGLCYRVDLRLRPEGSLGEVCISLQGAVQYYSSRARDWELQMLIKGRVAAADKGPGQRLLDIVEPRIYSSTLDFTAVEAVSATRIRIQEKLQQRKLSPGEVDVKLAPGGIRDIEFLVQCLQRLHGGREPWVRHGGTLLALFRLRDKDFLSDVESQRLNLAYTFLRDLEHRLQFEDDRQTHMLPQDSDALEVLAKRMPAAQLGAAPSAHQLMQLLQQHLEYVAEIYERVIHAQQPMYYSGFLAPPPREEPAAPTGWDAPPPPAAMDSNLVRFLDQKAPRLAGLLSRSRPKRNGKAFERYLESVIANAKWMNWLEEDPQLASYLLDVFECSPFLSEQLMRFPDLLQTLREVRRKPDTDSMFSDAAALEDANDLRRFFRVEMFRIQCESICRGAFVFQTLKRASALADAAIQAVYRISVQETMRVKPPASPSYVPLDQLLVVALGRLGMGEFDIGSDADLIFVLPESEAAEHEFWTKVATRIIDHLAAYTHEGFMFVVDTRLRPNGREGEMVQMESSYKNYFSSRAEAWEGITYMKARAVAGSAARATQFLKELQALDWRRYGQSGRSLKQLRDMRLRLQKEHARDNPLKAGSGGYYDVDFALMYLRLKGAGIFYTVLNTPERIDVVEQMGHLERSDADFLRDAAIFYRALDHGLRVITGQAQGALPKSPSHVEMLDELLSRWTPDHLHDEPVDAELARIQERSREFFYRLFNE